MKESEEVSSGLGKKIGEVNLQKECEEVNLGQEKQEFGEVSLKNESEEVNLGLGQEKYGEVSLQK